MRISTYFLPFLCSCFFALFSQACTSNRVDNSTDGGVDTTDNGGNSDNNNSDNESDNNSNNNDNDNDSDNKPAVVRTLETQKLLLWLGRENLKPALGGHWGGKHDTYEKVWESKPRAVGWEEQKKILGKEPLVLSFEYVETKYVDEFYYGQYWDYIQGFRRKDIRRLIIEKAKQGGIITLVEHMPNFVTNPREVRADEEGISWKRNDTTGNARDRNGGNVIKSILPNGSHHEAYQQYLDDMADYFDSLRVDGTPIPILFRPFHEMNGGWFWWGNSELKEGETQREIVKLWRFTWNYLTHTRALRNLIWIWSLNIEFNYNNTSQDFNTYWPGSTYVDVIALDGYIFKSETNMLPETNMLNEDSGDFAKTYKKLEQIAMREGLPLAISEFGFNYEDKREAAVWQEKLPRFLKSLSLQPSYFLIWNSPFGPMAPAYSGEDQADDEKNFREFIFDEQGASRFLLLE